MARYDIDRLVEETLGALGGHTLDQEQVTWLADPVDDETTTLPVHDGTRVSRGIAEVGEELVYVASTGSTSLTLAPFGRGFQGTEPASHTANTRVTFAPRFPRARVREAINDVILGTWPKLFAVGEHSFAPNGPQVTYDMPDDALDVLTVKQKVFGPSQFEFTFTQWGFNPRRKTLDLIQRGFYPGNDVQVTYMKKPSTIAADGEFADSGLDVRAWPCIKYGVLHMLISPQDAGTTGLHRVEASENQRENRSSSTALSRQYYAVYQQLLLDERDRLLAEYERTNNEEIL